jgi:hypothetical protein
MEDLCKKKEKIIELESIIAKEINTDRKIKFLREILDYNSEANKKIDELEKKNQELQNLISELRNTDVHRNLQIQFNQFLECYINEKKEQISKERDGDKQKILREELKNLQEIQKEQDQTQENYNFLNIWTTIHSNFTSELISLWKKYNFAAFEVKNWININSPANQAREIKNPAYYAWLRDIKKVDSEWVHNHGNNASLKKEYQEYLQRQNQIEIPPKSN